MASFYNTAFFSLLRSGLLGLKPEPVSLSSEQWQSLYAMAYRQSVQGVIFCAVEQLSEGSGLPAELAADWLMQVRKIEGDFRRQQAVAQKQAATWQKYGVDAVLLKGLSVAKFYPQPERRVSGDIDWWMRTPADWSRALEVLSANDLAPEVDSDGDIHYNLAGVVVEHHREGLVEDSPEGVLLLLSEHIMHHAMVFGVGMRQLCDYYLARKAMAFSEQHYKKLLAAHGMLKWNAVLDECLSAMMEGSPRRNALLELVLSDGNMGLDKRWRFSGFFKRAALFAGVAPVAFWRRWWGLAIGRMKKN